MKLTRLGAFAFLACFAFTGTASAASKWFDAEKYGLPGESFAVYCKDTGHGRKRVWMNTADGSYALNGQAISFVKNTSGIDWKLGRDHLSPSTVRELIQVGLKQCD